MSEPSPSSQPAVQEAVDREDAFALARVASKDDIDRLKAAEDLFERVNLRKRRSSRFAAASQALVGYIALAGFFFNAYQSYVNKQQQERQRESDQTRWEREFRRAELADKYRAFFETSVLATDTVNPNKRLVGYALLEEFVADKDYNSKATLMLEESLVQELQALGDRDLDPIHANAIDAILIALAHTSDCHSLQRAARSIDKVALRTNQVKEEESEEVFDLYVRRLIGRAVLVCGSMKEFRAVREPLASTLLKSPALGGLKGKPTPPQVHERIALLLHATCADELNVSGVTDCPEILHQYAGKLCGQLSPQEASEETPGCAVIQAAAAEIPLKPAGAATPNAP